MSLVIKLIDNRKVTVWNCWCIKVIGDKLEFRILDEPDKLIPMKAIREIKVKV